MAFTNFAYLTPASSGATRNSGTNGDLNALLDWALTGNSNWVRLYHDGTNFYDVWQPAAGGPCLTVHHNSAQSGSPQRSVVRMCESASGASTYTDPFPTVAQVADTSSNWLVSSLSNTTTRDFHILVWETGIIYATKYSGVTDRWEMGYALQCPSRFASDTTNNWICGVTNNAAPSGGDIIAQNVTTVPAGSTQANVNFWMRNAQGTIKSERGNIGAPGSILGVVSGCPAITAGFGSAIERRKVMAHGIGSSTTTLGASAIIDRGVIPQMWAPLHSALTGIGEADTITDGSSTFILLKSVAGGGVLLQTSNDWTGYPNG